MGDLTTHPECHALLRAILTDPASDAARLVYADWLEETGETPRAEFVRVQVDAERLEAVVADWASRPDSAGGAKAGAALAAAQALRRRERELLEQASDHWWGDGNVEWVYLTPVFRRGFVASVTLATADFLAHAQDLFAVQPITEVRLTDRQPLFSLANRHWWVGSAGSLWSAEFIPDPLYMRLPPLRKNRFCWGSREAAYAALSRACVAYGREQAGLPLLSEETKR